MKVAAVESNIAMEELFGFSACVAAILLLMVDPSCSSCIAVFQRYSTKKLALLCFSIR
jgi:hypothetical protein